MSKYGTFSGPYFPVFGLNRGIYEPEKTPYLDTFHAVLKSLTRGKAIEFAWEIRGNTMNLHSNTGASSLIAMLL